MAATPYDFTTTTYSTKKKRRIPLPRLGAAGFGGGFGLLLIAIGLLVIGLGWNGMAGGGGEVNGVPNLNAQLPWLISGGILGLALVVFGASMIVVNNARSDRARLEAKLDELVQAVSRGATTTAAPYPGERTATAAPAGVFVAGASVFHDPSCRLVQGRDDVTFVTAAEADAQGLKPCRVCKPVAATSR
ncbi:MAG TPA: hypothetical protein VH274_06300 [Mycobacteriales bacterium]|jgi:hypothetical protein|nr:hypothetical protein [Mycobacteriales bacterium]